MGKRKSSDELLLDEVNKTMEEAPRRSQQYKEALKLKKKIEARIAQEMEVESEKPKIYFIKHEPNAIIPRKENQAVGYDLFSVESKFIEPNTVEMFETNIKVLFPPGGYGRIASRSGLALFHRISVQAGVIDPDYRGTLKVILLNTSPDIPYLVDEGDRIAQLIIEQYIDAEPVVVNDFPFEKETDRSAFGLGSTGYN